MYWPQSPPSASEPEAYPGNDGNGSNATYDITGDGPALLRLLVEGVGSVVLVPVRIWFRWTR